MTEQPRVLAGRRALVTGGAGGLGRAFARALALHGSDVAILDIDPQVERYTVELEASGVRAFAIRADISNPDEALLGVERSAALMGGLDIVVNNAAVVRVTRPLEDDFAAALADFESVVSVNLRGTYLVGRAAISHLARRGGHIVNITTDHVHTCGYPVAIDHADAPLCPLSLIHI